MEPRLTSAAEKYETMRGASDYVEFVKAMGLSQLSHRPALDILAERVGADRAARFKTAVGAQGTATGLAQARVSRDYLAGVLPMTVLGQLAGALPVPINVNVPAAQLTTTADFIAEGAGYPMVAAYVQSLLLPPAKLGLIVAISNELLKMSDDRATRVVDRVLRRAMIRGLNNAVLGTAAAVESERPAGLLRGVSGVSGGSPSNLDDDLVATVLLCRGGVPDAPVWIISPLAAVYLQSIDARFQQVSMHPARPGVLFGAPQIACEAAGSKAILVDAAAITYSDAGIAIETAGHTTLQMSDTPTGDALTGTGTTMVSMFQTGAVAIKADWFVTWKKGDDAVSYCDLPLPVGSPAW